MAANSENKPRMQPAVVHLTGTVQPHLFTIKAIQYRACLMLSPCCVCHIAMDARTQRERVRSHTVHAMHYMRDKVEESGHTKQLRCSMQAGMAGRRSQLTKTWASRHAPALGSFRQSHVVRDGRGPRFQQNLRLLFMWRQLQAYTLTSAVS